MKVNSMETFQPRDGGELESFNLKMLETQKTLHLTLGCQQGLLINKHLFHQVYFAQNIWASEHLANDKYEIHSYKCNLLNITHVCEPRDYYQRHYGKK